MGTQRFQLLLGLLLFVSDGTFAASRRIRTRAQSLKIDGNRLEVNHAPYLELGRNVTDVSVIDNRFEADTAAVSTNHPFILQNGSAGRFIGNAFNRNTGTQFEVGETSTVNVISANMFRGGVYPATALAVKGFANTITGNIFSSDRTGIEVDLVGPHNSFTGNSPYSSGSLRANSGARNTITGNTLYKLAATSAVLGVGGDFWINAKGSVGTVIASNTLDNHTGTVTTTGGIQTGDQQAITGNSLRRFMGTGDGAIGIAVVGSESTFTGNRLTGASWSLSTSTGNVFQGNGGHGPRSRQEVDFAIARARAL